MGVWLRLYGHKVVLAKLKHLIPIVLSPNTNHSRPVCYPVHSYHSKGNSASFPWILQASACAFLVVYWLFPVENLTVVLFRSGAICVKLFTVDLEHLINCLFNPRQIMKLLILLQILPVTQVKCRWLRHSLCVFRSEVHAKKCPDASLNKTKVVCTYWSDEQPFRAQQAWRIFYR